MMHPDDRAENVAAVQTAMTGNQQSCSCRYRLIGPGGLVRHMEWHARLVRDERGEVVRLVGATTDVTNEVQTNELLVRQAEQERVLLDRLNIATQAAGISSWEIDLTARRFLWVENPLPGIGSTTDLLSLDEFAQRIHPEDQNIFRDQLHLALGQRQDRVSCRYRVVTHDQRLVHVQISARLIAD